MKKKENTSGFSCQLTTPEFRERTAGILAVLKQKMTVGREVPDGFSFCFPSDDEMLDTLIEFIKSERKCCNFFTFELSIPTGKNEIWLTLKGEEGIKEFMETELNFGLASSKQK